ncbi:MAG TPA: SCO family protein [Blastocatellia bacterium]|nr:SCO family protein [Blastocatellia bacterium]
MKSTNRRELIAMLGAAPFVGSGARSYDREFNPGALSSRDVIRDRYFPNVVLTTHEGRKVRFYDDLVKDKIVTINMMFTDCDGVCPGITANLVKVQKALGKRVGRDIFMYSITLKPEQDSPKALKEYAKMHGVEPGWTFLTGEAKDIETLRRKLGFTNPDRKLDADKSQHIGMVRYGNEALERWGACPGLANASWIVESILFVDWPPKTNARLGEKGARK